MKHKTLGLSVKTWLGLAVTAFAAQGCAQQGGYGMFTADTTGGARVCVASPVSPADSQSVLVQMQVSNEGGWCGITTSRNGTAFASYLGVARAAHGRVFAHRVGANTRIDYTPDRGYVGTDSFAVRMIPGNAVIQAGVTVSR